MSQMTLKIVAELHDKATKKLKSLDQTLESTTKTVDKAVIHFTHLNKIFGKTTSSVTALARAYRDLKSAIGSSLRLPNISSKIPRTTPLKSTTSAPNIDNDLLARQDYKSMWNKLERDRKDELKRIKAHNKEQLGIVKERIAQKQRLEAVNAKFSKQQSKEDYQRLLQQQKATAPNIVSGNVEKQFKAVGGAVKATAQDLTKFNQILFTTAAFVGTFTGGALALFTSISEGAKFDRLYTQFQNAFGKDGDLITSIRKFTDTSVDQMEAMRTGLALKSFGIAASVDEVAELVSRASVAAKRAGIESAEGIKAVTDFIKTSNISQLKNLNLIRENDPALKLYTATISKYTGVMGGTLNAQEKLAWGLSIMRRVTAGSMKGFRDLLDTLNDTKQNISFLAKEIGITLGASLQNFLETVNNVALALRPIIRQLRESDKGFQFLIKSVLGTTAALSGLIVTVGLFRLAIKGLGALGVGLPKVIGLLGLMVGGFLTVTSAVKKNKEEFAKATTPLEKFTLYFKYLGEKLQVFGAFLRASYEALTTFFEPENYRKGIGFINSEVADLLQTFGLLTIEIDKTGKRVANTGPLVSFVRTLAVTLNFIRGMKDAVVSVFKAIADAIDIATDRFRTLFGFFKNNPIPREYLETAKELGKVFGYALTAYGLLKGAKGIAGIFMPGRGGKNGPAGTKTDPLFVVSMDSVASSIFSFSKDKTKTPKVPGELGKLAKLAPFLKKLPFVGMMLAGAYSAYEVFSANTKAEKARAIGGTLGALGGGAIGSFAGPVGTLAGGLVGQQVGGEIADYVSTKFLKEPASMRSRLKYNEGYDRKHLLGSAFSPISRNTTTDEHKRLLQNIATSLGKPLPVVLDNSTLNLMKESNDTFRQFMTTRLLQAEQFPTASNKYSGISTLRERIRDEATIPGYPDFAASKEAGSVTQQQAVRSLLDEALTSASAKSSIQAQEVAAAISRAMSESSEGAKNITPEEYYSIMKMALDDSSVAKNTKKTISNKCRTGSGT